jgi:hypothetical protein
MIAHHAIAFLPVIPPQDSPPVCLPPEARAVSLLGVNYAHLHLPDGGDLYLTHYGAAQWEHLLPHNWLAREWFEANRRRLVGTSTIYHTHTRRIHGRKLDLVLRWSRVGEDVPGFQDGHNRFLHAEFNSPFEEFALLLEMRAGRHGPPDIRIRTKRPLAIYAVPDRMQLWQTGRSQSRIDAKLARHPGVELDILRQYAMLYSWIDGLDLVEAADHLNLKGQARTNFLAHHTSVAIHEMELKGYRVLDMKAAHVVVRPGKDGRLLHDKHGQLAHAMVDYELLERTPKYEKIVQAQSREYYIQHMAHRFDLPPIALLPPHLQLTSLLGVDYVFGRAQSTGGALWVVGHDPDLFHYFLPERWRRIHHKRLSARNEIFSTRTKDGVMLVWKVSRLGEIPPRGPNAAITHALQEYGFNSPFEEFAFALDLARRGVRTVYPRAIYRTGRATGKPADLRHYERLAGLRTPDDQPAVCAGHDYITLWGFWNRPYQFMTASDGHAYRGVDLKRALHESLITAAAQAVLLNQMQEALHHAGYESLHLKPDHVMLSLDPAGNIIKDTTGQTELYLCNLQWIRPLSPAPAGQAGKPALQH